MKIYHIILRDRETQTVVGYYNGSLTACHAYSPRERVPGLRQTKPRSGWGTPGFLSERSWGDKKGCSPYPLQRHARPRGSSPECVAVNPVSACPSRQSAA